MRLTHWCWSTHDKIKKKKQKVGGEKRIAIRLGYTAFQFSVYSIAQMKRLENDETYPIYFDDISANVEQR